jgi:hypothetical protein
VIAEPPSFGAVKLTVALPLLTIAEILVGTLGAIAAGVTADDALEAVLVPTELVATTVKVYAVPLVSPVTVIGDEAPVAVRPSGEEVTVYPVITAPPLLAGAVKLTVALPLLTMAEILVGTPGAIGAGVTADDALEAVPVPTEFVAVTVKVYAVPLVNPVTVIGDEAPVAVRPSGEEVTVYPVITAPPVFVGAVKLTVALPLLPVAEILVGTPGAVIAGVTADDALEAAPVPIALVATTVKV